MEVFPADTLSDDGAVSGPRQGLHQKHHLDPFLVTYLHLGHFSGHGNAEGEMRWKKFESAGRDRNGRELFEDAFNYSNVQLENSGPVHFRASTEEVNIDPVTFKGKDTNFKIEGNVRFAGRRTSH